MPRGLLASLLGLLFLLAGCATQTSALLRDAPVGLPRSVELAATPFYPQERYQCGPAALAMTIAAAGIAVEPAALVSQVYLPEREGSLQLEMLAAGRRNGAFSVTIPPRMEALLAEVAAGNPVLVLQNLSLPWMPLWHYAVVVGYDLDAAEIVLRSGTTARAVMALSTFEHTWQRSESWGMVALAPGRLPQTPEEAPIVAAAIAFEASNTPATARRVYAAALERWPQNLPLLLGLGNSAYAAGDIAAAADAFGRAAAAHPQSAPALNNLAFALSALGRYGEARAAAQQALALGGPWQSAVQETLRNIEAAALPR